VPQVFFGHTVLGCRQMLLIFGTSQSEHFSCGTQSIEQDYPGCFSVFSLSGVGLILYFGLIFCLKYFLFKGYETWIGSSRPELFSGIDLSVCVVYSSKSTLSLVNFNCVDRVKGAQIEPASALCEWSSENFKRNKYLVTSCLDTQQPGSVLKKLAYLAV